MMKELKGYIKPYYKQIIWVCLFLVAQTLGTLFIPTLLSNIVNQGIVMGDIPYILQTGFVMLVVAALTGTFAILGTYFTTSFSSSLGYDIRNQIIKKSQQFSMNDLNEVGTSSMITRATSDVNQIQQTVTMFLQMLLPAPIMIIGGLFLAFSKDVTMGFIIVGMMIIFSIIAAIMAKKALPLFTLLQNKLDHINQVVRENITGIRVIRAFTKEAHETKRMQHVFSDYAELAIRVNKIYAIMMPIVMLVMNVGTIAIIWFGANRISVNQMEIGDIMAVLEYAMLILFYLIMGIMVFMMLPRAKASMVRLNEVLLKTPEIKDGTKTCSRVENGQPILEFKNVSFSYPLAEEPVLSNLNFKAYKGETVAIIGGTGSGKSTLIQLIPRLYDVTSGEILINQGAIKEMKQSNLRDQIGFIPQKAFLFSGTILENLQYGNKYASFEDVIEASSIAQAHDFIEALPEQYHSKVAQGGNNFSGGQKQRLAIARALVKKPLIYIFDDSFSALDFKTDAMLRQALKPAIKDGLVLIVAQRIQTIREADQIIVLDEGKICAIGKHNELIKHCQVYQEIAASQLSEEEL